MVWFFNLNLPEFGSGFGSQLVFLLLALFISLQCHKKIHSYFLGPFLLLIIYLSRKFSQEPSRWITKSRMNQQKIKRRVGKYEIGRTIGEGTFAKVKFARNSETGEPVALKILDKEKVLKHKMAEQVSLLDITCSIVCFALSLRSPSCAFYFFFMLFIGLYGFLLPILKTTPDNSPKKLLCSFV